MEGDRNVEEVKEREDEPWRLKEQAEKKWGPEEGEWELENRDWSMNQWWGHEGNWRTGQGEKEGLAQTEETAESSCTGDRKRV